MLMLAMMALAAQAWAAEPLQESKLRLGLLSTRALARFRAADSLAANLEQRGLRPRASAAALRTAIESALDRAEAALGKDDARAAQRALDRAEALIDRLAPDCGC
jgi:hypothetical protein